MMIVNTGKSDEELFLDFFFEELSKLSDKYKFYTKKLFTDYGSVQAIYVTRKSWLGWFHKTFIGTVRFEIKLYDTVYKYISREDIIRATKIAKTKYPEFSDY